MAEGNIERVHDTAQRMYVIAGEQGLIINLTDTINNQIFLLVDSRGDIIIIEILPLDSNLTVKNSILTHQGTIVTHYANGKIYVGIKFGSVYGTQGWNVYGTSTFPYWLSRGAMPV